MAVKKPLQDRRVREAERAPGPPKTSRGVITGNTLFCFAIIGYGIAGNRVTGLDTLPFAGIYQPTVVVWAHTGKAATPWPCTTSCSYAATAAVFTQRNFP
jgi:hypothetical protein